MRVYELADELGVSSDDVIETLEDEFDLEISNHMSGVDDDVASLLKEFYQEDGHDTETDENGAKSPPSEEETSADDIEDESEEPSTEEPAELEQDRESPEESDDDTTTASDSSNAPDEIDTLTIEGSVTTEELAHQLGIQPNEAIKDLMDLGMMATINQTLNDEAIELLADEYGIDVEFVKSEQDEDLFDSSIDMDLDQVDEDEIVSRPPVITVMGHVDHGKTQLLDTIRESDVRSSESGGITQHIGAYRVNAMGHDVVFIDTPGHEAFTEMRARGANVTDIVVLVVAADDGVMPQTVESINHAREADVPIIVAINKMDLPEADPDRVRQQLSEHEIITEEWGGDTIAVELSALEGNGIEELLEMIDLQSEVMELQTSPALPTKGTVIEAEMQEGMGATATVLVQQGVLERGDIFVAGSTWGNARAIIDSRGDRVDEIQPGSPAEVLGFDDLPQPGDILEVVESKSEARERAEERQDKLKKAQQSDQGKVTMDQLQEFIEQEKVKNLNLLIKADTRGSIEVLEDSLGSLDSDEVETRIIHTGVGGINESDIMLAEASDGLIIGFNVRPDSRARKLASEKGIEIKTYSVVYEAIQDVRAALEGMLEPELEEQVIGRVEVREVFSVPGVGNIAGSYVEQGIVKRSANARVVRDGVLVHDGEISSLKRFKEDVSEVDEGYECGIGLGDFNDIKEGDVIEVYEEQEVAATL